MEELERETMETREARSGGGKGSLRLFGVMICGGDAAAKSGTGVGEEVLRKSKSMGNLASAERAAESEATDRGYLSDGGLRKPGKRRRRAGVGGHERKKGIPWTEEEHRTFLEGLEKLGKGDWRGISRKFVITRTPTQVASHAQKYFIRQSIPSNRRRRSSLFDVACIPETVPAVSFNGAQKGSDESNFLSQDKKRVGTVSSPGQERHPGLHLVVDRGGVSRLNSCDSMSTDGVPFKLRTHQPAPSEGYAQLFPC